MNARNRAFFVALAFIQLAIGIGGCHSSSKSTPFQTFQTGNEVFKVRVLSYEERCSLVSGAYYEFQTGRVGDTAWRTFLTFRDDDPREVQPEQIRFVSRGVAYAYVGWLYAVTTDAGESWSTWDATKAINAPERYRLIQNVMIASNGEGTMLLRFSEWEEMRLHTINFGRDWAPMTK